MNMNQKRWMPSKSVVMALMAISSGSSGGVSAVLSMQSGSGAPGDGRQDYSLEMDHRISA